MRTLASIFTIAISVYLLLALVFYLCQGRMISWRKAVIYPAWLQWAAYVY